MITTKYFDSSTNFKATLYATNSFVSNSLFSRTEQTKNSEIKNWKFIELIGVMPIKNQFSPKINPNLTFCEIVPISVSLVLLIDWRPSLDKSRTCESDVIKIIILQFPVLDYFLYLQSWTDLFGFPSTLIN